jgi:glutaredoxin
VSARVTVYVRAGCHLCDDALDVLAAVARTDPFALEVVDIEHDGDLHRRYLERIPVIALDGEEVAELFADADDLRRRLRARAHAPGDR